MKRSTFLLISAIFLFILSAAMLFATSQMLTQTGVQTSDWATIAMHNVAIFMFALGVMNFVARNAADSPSMTAILLGNLIVLIGTTSYDLRLHMDGVMNSQVYVSAAIRGVFAIGFIYYLLKK